MKYRSRVVFLSGFIILSWAGLCLRLFQVQVLNGEHYQKEVLKQSHKKQNLPANRGNIYDRDNRPLTRNIIHYTLSVNPSKVINKKEIAEELSKQTGKPKEKYLDKLNSKSRFEYLERNLQRNELGLLETKVFTGLNIERKYRRYYPHENIGAQILGYTNLDDEGISGIEKDYNNYLKGIPGWVYKTKGWSGKIQHKSGMPFQKSINGSNIQLTIDLEYQSILEEELKKRQDETSSSSATGIIMDPETGEILAMATTPGFDNNHFGSSRPELHRIKSITDQFEPGSTFKVVSTVSALYNGLISLNDEFNCENGSYEYHTKKITDHESYSMLTASQIIHHSSNIGIIKIMDQVGQKKLFSMSRDFGFGSKTGINLNGEVSGKLNHYNDWSAVSLGMIAMGHEVGVTAIQLASAYCAIANGGYLLKPRIVQQIMDESGNIIHSEEPVVLRKIADESTIKSVKDMLRGVVVKGTGKNADIPGWKVAGKTGTAQKWKNGKYSNNDFISNFIGFFPADNPQLLALIMLDEPSKPFHWGNEGAAVAFKRIMGRIINMDDTISPPLNDHVAFEPQRVMATSEKNNEELIKEKLPLILSTFSRNSKKTQY
ncbi:MAG: penicillin-binding protein 2, partial [Candidatus Neomarinimicrobiota bacterium]